MFKHVEMAETGKAPALQCDDKTLAYGQAQNGRVTIRVIGGGQSA